MGCLPVRSTGIPGARKLNSGPEKFDDFGPILAYDRCARRRLTFQECQLLSEAPAQASQIEDPMVGKIVLSLVLAFSSVTLFAASNPVPLIYQPLMPTSVEPGHAAFTLTVHGTGFVSGAVIKANGTALKTTFVNFGTLTAEIPATAVAKAGTGSITVSNPGSIDSNVIYFTVRKSSVGRVRTDPASIEGGYLAVGDFNNDNKPDIAVANANVDVYQNVGKGNFNEIGGPAFNQSGSWPPVMVADFNNDGNLDVAPCGGDGGPGLSCSIYFGDGKGDLTPGTYEQQVYPGVMADINGDGILDNIAIEDPDGYGSYLAINLGNGDGTYTNVTYVATSVAGIPVVGDFNDDGKLDVAISVIGDREPGPGTVAVFLGNGDGTVQNEVDYQIPWGGNYAAVADLNGDGKLDIVTSGFSVLLGNGDGTFTAGTSFAVQDDWTAPVEIADMNGDGKLDVVTVSDDLQNGTQSVDILLGKGDGTFQTPIAFKAPASNFYTIGIADFNGDGLLDFAINGAYQSTVFLQTPAK